MTTESKARVTGRYYTNAGPKPRWAVVVNTGPWAGWRRPGFTSRQDALAYAKAWNAAKADERLELAR